MKRSNKEEMKVTVKSDTNKLIEWQYIGGASFIFNNHYIKPKQKFTARVNEIPKAFRDVVVPLTGLEIEDIPVIVSEANKPIFTKRKKEGEEDLWEVIDANGKVWNEVGLKEEVADQFINDLSK